ncbi:fimbrial protein [Acinetobacter sp. ULE_I001]|jgi:major type 1 subunit fimbrin (pilin)|uniref:fimbrial protein n=1 Tax=unclassified Acinetobacter TaxID=196816 RepID=UPI00265506A1|nr:type 1 fimbrial protein [Staphylococcus equorum]
MKKLTLPALGTLALSLACSSVFAADGTITINGMITDETCTLAGSGSGVNGSQNLVLTLDTVLKSTFTATNMTAARKNFSLQLKNAAGTGNCDASTNKALKGLYLSPISTADLDTTDKTLLVNKATEGGASIANPVYIQILTDADIAVNLSEPWGVQAKSAITGLAADGSGTATMLYKAQYASKTGTVSGQNVTAVVNYTLQYN